MHGQAVDLALGRGKAPGLGVLSVEGRIGDVDLAAVVGDNRKAAIGAPGDAVVESIQNGAIEAEAIDQPGIEVGNEELLGRPVEDDVAKPGAAIGGDGGEQRNLAGRAIHLVDAAGRALGATRRAPLAGHELRARGAELAALRVAAGIGNNEVEAEGRGRGQVDIGHLGVVEGDAEDLPDVARLGGKHRRRGDQLALRRPIGLQLLDDHRAAVGIDEGLVDGIARGGRCGGRQHAGKAGDDRLARRVDRALLGVGRCGRQHECQRQCGQLDHGFQRKTTCLRHHGSLPPSARPIAT